MVRRKSTVAITHTTLQGLLIQGNAHERVESAPSAGYRDAKRTGLSVLVGEADLSG
jgi:hypothetical protein